MDRLQDVVQGLNETFSGVHDALVRSGHLSRDPEIAKELKEGTGRFLALTVARQERSDNDVEELTEQEPGELVADALASSSASMIKGSSELRHFVAAPYHHPTIGAKHEPEWIIQPTPELWSIQPLIRSIFASVGGEQYSPLHSGWL